MAGNQQELRSGTGFVGLVVDKNSSKTMTLTKFVIIGGVVKQRGGVVILHQKRPRMPKMKLTDRALESHCTRPPREQPSAESQRKYHSTLIPQSVASD